MSLMKKTIHYLKGNTTYICSTIITVIVVLEVTTNGRMIQTTPMRSLL